MVKNILFFLVVRIAAFKGDKLIYERFHVDSVIVSCSARNTIPSVFFIYGGGEKGGSGGV